MWQFSLTRPRSSARGMALRIGNADRRSRASTRGGIQVASTALAVLVRVFGDIDIAEEAVQDAFTAAVQRWPSTGLPPSPAGWIISTARNRAINRLRREASCEDRHAQAALLHACGEPAQEGPVRDDRLRLIFTCCHPLIPTNAPSILAGIRTATATLGAIVASGGLGPYILDGLQRQEEPRLFVGALLVALLAIATEVAFNGLERLLVSPGMHPDAAKQR